MAQLVMVRHGQASLGTADYDVLSQTGIEQSRVAGRHLASAGITPDLLVRGSMRRHDETAGGVLEAMAPGVPTIVDPGWDEYDFEHVLDVERRFTSGPGGRGGAVPDGADDRANGRGSDLGTDPAAFHRAFQRDFERATGRWTDGAFDDDYDEPFPGFRRRVAEALTRSQRLLEEHRTVVVVSSGGPIAMTAALLLLGPVAAHETVVQLWAKLNRVCVNTGVTTVVHGRTGSSLSTFNDHHHLRSRPGLLTYR